jgi:hypothetical protein
MKGYSNRIPIATYVKRVNDSFGKDGNIVHSLATNSPELASRIVQALFETGIDLAEFIQDSLMSKERLSKADSNHARSTTPLSVDREVPLVSPEILGWSIAILASAWSQWVFTSRSNEQSAYQTDPVFKEDASRLAARTNVRLALPYIRCSILDAIDKATNIGNSNNTNFEPKPEVEPYYLDLRKNC